MAAIARGGLNNNVLNQKQTVDPKLPVESSLVTVTTAGNNSQNITQFPDIVDADRGTHSAQFINGLDQTTRMRERHSSSSSGNVQTGERGMSSSPHNDTTRNNPEQSVITQIDQRRSESPAIDYRTIDHNRTHNIRSSPTQAATTTDISGSRPIQTQDLNVGVVSRMDGRHEALPDLLHSHVIPSQVPSARHSAHRPPGHMVDPRGIHPQSHVRHHHRSHRDGHRSHHHHHRSRRRSRSTSQSENEPCKDSCLKCLAATTSFRWILVILSLLGVCCVVTGIVLAALHAAGNSFLFLAIMFIGLGVLLVVVVAVGWKCTPRGHEPLHALFSLGDFRRQRGTRRQHRQHGGHRSREGHWYGGVLYPEFQYRRPPPSYNASMQDYQTQLALAQSHREYYNDEDLPAEDYSLPSSPPPSYRSRASTVRTGIQITFPQGDQYPNSRPPTYRSHISTSRSQAHSRPSLPRDDNSGEGEGQGGDVAFNGPESVSNTGTLNRHSRNNSETVNNVNPCAVTISVGNSGNNSSSLDVEKVQQILHSRQPSGSAINSANFETSATDDHGLDQDVQQTLQTLDNATSSAQVENSSVQPESGDNVPQNPASNDDDDYPMLTSL